MAGVFAYFMNPENDDDLTDSAIFEDISRTASKVPLRSKLTEFKSQFFWHIQLIKQIWNNFI